MVSTPTWQRLREALFEAGFSELAARAGRGEFDDFRSPHALPKMELIRLLCKRGRRGREFAERVKSGEFDNTKAEADAWFASKEGQDTLRELMEQP